MAASCVGAGGSLSGDAVAEAPPPHAASTRAEPVSKIKVLRLSQFRDIGIDFFMP
ncbi:hypothetical protein ACI2UY_05330 [Ralstonia nicotianae]